jgi:rare lipoprotein A
MNRIAKTKKIAISTFLTILMSAAPLAKANNAHATRPKDRLSKLGIASWYSKRSPGINRRTANNEIFDDTALTCAMWDVPFHQKIKVTNLENGKSIIVRVNDRGPHRRLKERVIDLTQRAFSELDSTQKGLINVQIEFL